MMLDDNIEYYDDIGTVCECLIDGKLIKYDGCSSRSLVESTNFYKGYYYIGSNNGTIYINGTKHEFHEIHHFFSENIKYIRKIKIQKLNS